MRPGFPRELNTTIIIGTDDMRKRMGEVLNCVNLRRNEFVIKREHHPLAVLIPMQKYKALIGLMRKFTLYLLKHKDSDLSQEEGEAFTANAKHKSRKNLNKVSSTSSY